MRAEPAAFARTVLSSAALLMLGGVIMAALGAHAFREHLVEAAALRYVSALGLHLATAPALIGLALAGGHARFRLWQLAALMVLAGLLLFSGGLYLAALDLTTALLPLVPYGGGSMILGWLCAALAFALGPAARPA